MQQQQCMFCGNLVSLVHVHGHYQCPVCKTNAIPCCSGDNCSTDLTMNEPIALSTDNQSSISSPVENTGSLPQQ